MQTIKCFEVMGHTDTTEGRAPMKVAARFTTRKEAEKYINSPAYTRWCVMGVPYKEAEKYHITEQTICVLDYVEELAELQKQETIQKALSKLTAEERKVLGLE